MGNLHITTQILSSTCLIISICLKFIENPVVFFIQDISLQCSILPMIQILQLLDLVVLRDKNSQSVPQTLLHHFIRIVISWFFIDQEINRYWFTALAVCWGVGDWIRYIYMVFPSIGMGNVKANMGLILIIVGGVTEIGVVQNFVKRHAAELTVQQILNVRVQQAIFILIMVFLAIRMIQMRSKYLQLRPMQENDKVKIKIN